MVGFPEWASEHRQARAAPPHLPPTPPPCTPTTVLTGGLSVSHRDGRLALGDELLVINGHLLVGLSHEEAVAILRSASGVVQLVVASKVGHSGLRCDSTLRPALPSLP